MSAPWRKFTQSSISRRVGVCLQNIMPSWPAPRGHYQNHHRNASLGGRRKVPESQWSRLKQLATRSSAVQVRAHPTPHSEFVAI